MNPRSLRLRSPLTPREEWGTPWYKGETWTEYAAACPCCRRPLDIVMENVRQPTVWRRSEAADGAEWSRPARDIKAGDELLCAWIPEGEVEHVVYGDPWRFDSALDEGVKLGDTVIATGPEQMVEDTCMIPIAHPAGMIDGRCFMVKRLPHELNGARLEDDEQRYQQQHEEEEEEEAQEEHEQQQNEDHQEHQQLHEEHWPKRQQNAVCAALWGANAGYALGALVLGARLRELEGDDGPAQVLLHTDDVPKNYLEKLAGFWNLKQVDYIEATRALYCSKGTGFDGVFTKLAAWSLEEYDKVLLLDIDIIPLQKVSPLFDLRTPAAFVRGHREVIDGEEVNGREFFCHANDEHTPWGQQGGINAGVILLRPSNRVLQLMVEEVKSEYDPAHLPASGPEQDYLTRAFANAPWHSMAVRWNFQIHHVPYALERALSWRKWYTDNSWCSLSDADVAWRPPRLKIPTEEIAVVHFSGDVKMWHQFLNASQERLSRRNVAHVQCSWPDVEEFVEHFLKESIEGYRIYVSRCASEEEYAYYNLKLHRDRLFLMGADRSDDVTSLVDEMVERLREVTSMAARVWRASAEKLIEKDHELLKELQHPVVPVGSYSLGQKVEICWHGWYTSGTIVSVKANGSYTVRYDQGGDWGDTEQGVTKDRLKLWPVNGEVKKIADEEGPLKRCAIL